ncbi:MAG: hypothetical protein OHK0031_09510 [Anaerolineales bacterium]
MSKFRFFISLIIFLLPGLSACQPSASAQPVESAATSEAPVPATPILQPTATPSLLERYYIPTYYSAFYGEILTASQSEELLTIYSDISAAALQPLLRVFNEHYPWITISLQEADGSQVFQRYYADLASASPSADLIISSDSGGWQEAIARGEIRTYLSQEDAYLPGWARSAIGIYSISADPLLIVYDKNQVGTRPESLGQVAALDPAVYAGRVVTLDAQSNNDALITNWYYTKALGQSGWERLSKIGAAGPGLLASTGEILHAINSGQAAIGYFIPASQVFPAIEGSPNLAWSYIKDGQPLLVHHMGMPQGGQHSASAKLLIDFTLSQEGQMALALGSLTPIRPDVFDVTNLHLDRVGQEVGAENMLYFAFDAQIAQPGEREAFLAQWNLTMGRNALPATPTAAPTP